MNRDQNTGRDIMDNPISDTYVDPDARKPGQTAKPVLASQGEMEVDD